MTRQRTLDVEKIYDLLAPDVQAAALTFAKTRRRGDVTNGLDRAMEARAGELAGVGLPDVLRGAAVDVMADSIEEVVNDLYPLVRIWSWALATYPQDEWKEVFAALNEPSADAFEKINSEYISAIRRNAKIELSDELWEALLSGRLVDPTRKALEQLRTYPFSYVLSVRTPLPTSWREAFGDPVKIGSATLESGAWLEVHPDEVATHGPDELPNQEEYDLEPMQDFLYLTGEHTGFLTRLPAQFEVPVAVLRHNLKALLGLCLATELLVMDDRPRWSHVEPVIVFENSAGTGMKLALRWLPPEEAAAFGALFAAPIETDAHRLHLKKYGRWIIAALNGNDLLTKAARWFFESHCGTNHLLQLVQAITVLEILYGEHDDKARRRSALGTTELLANRFGYSVASGPARQKAMREFMNVYDARSRVVHSGRDEVPPDLIKAARRMCVQAITHELTVLSATDS